MHDLHPPYLIFLGDVTLVSDAKTGFGLRDWCRDRVMGEWALPRATVSLGLPELPPAQAAAAGARSVVIGVAAVGGQLPPDWVPTLVDALDAGLDLVSGMHTRLESEPRLVAAARRSGARLINVRHVDGPLPIGNGIRRSGLRVLTVGTDCALGKKYTALALTQALRAQGARASFRATGQTGIAITGWGIAVDHVIADYVNGAAESLIDQGAEHGDLLFREGQGSLLHPGYSAVTQGLLHGSQPDVLVLQHLAGQTHNDDYPSRPIPPLRDVVALYELSASAVRPAAVAAIALNTKHLDDAGARQAIATAEAETGLVAAALLG